MLNIYYNISGIWPAFYCVQTDTMSLGLLAPGIGVIRVIPHNIDDQNDTQQHVYPNPILVFIWPVGINDVPVDKGLIYPNPVPDVLNIKCEEAITRVLLTDIQGRIIKQYANVKPHINMQGIAKGIYYLYIETEKRRYIERIIKE